MEEQATAEVVSIIEHAELVVHGGATFEEQLAKLKTAVDELLAEEFQGAADALNEATLLPKELSEDEYVRAGELRSAYREKSRQLAERLKPMKQRVDQIKDVFLLAEKRLCPVLDEACKKHIDPKMNAYEAEQKRLAALEQARLEQEARKREEEQRLAQAIELEKQGVPDKLVEEVLNAPIEPPPVRAPINIPRLAGQSSTDRYSCEVVSWRVLAKHIALGKVPENYGAPNMTVLNRVAHDQKTAFNVPGCRWVMNKIRSSR